MDAIENPDLIAVLARVMHMPALLPPDIITSILIVLVLALLGAWAVRGWRERPGTLQNLTEWLIEGLGGLSKQIVGPTGPRYLPLFGTLFLFILCANLLGLIPGLHPPTANLSVNVGLALTVAFASQFVRIREHGITGYMRHFCGPPYWLAPLFLVIRIMEELIRPVSLALRLFGNIMAKEIVLSILIYLLTVFFFADDIYSKILLPVPLILRPLIILLGILVSVVQALVFTGLAMVYIGEAVHGD